MDYQGESEKVNEIPTSVKSGDFEAEIQVLASRTGIEPVSPP